jgi:two-component system, LytTR family, response regulator
MDNIKVVIVEDDLFTRKVVEQILKKHFTEIIVVGQTGSVKEALGLIRELQPELVILDVQLEDGDAFELLQRLEVINFKIVFMSAYQGYMEESMQFAAVEFVAKPFDENELALAVDKAIEALSDSLYHKKIEVFFSNIALAPDDWSIVFPTLHHPTTVIVKDIVYAEAVFGGCHFYTESGTTFFVPRPLRRYETLLSQYGFFRCHPLYVVNLRQIKKIDFQQVEIHFNLGRVLPFEGWRGNALMKRYNEIFPATQA